MHNQGVSYQKTKYTIMDKRNFEKLTGFLGQKI